MHRHANREFVQLRAGLNHNPRVGSSLDVECGYNHLGCDHDRHNGYNAWDSGFVVREGLFLAQKAALSLDDLDRNGASLDGRNGLHRIESLRAIQRNAARVLLPDSCRNVGLNHSFKHYDSACGSSISGMFRRG